MASRLALRSGGRKRVEARGELSIMQQLADAIQALEFGAVFRLVDDKVIEVDNEYAPNVYNDPDDDVYLEDSRWTCFTGLTGQYGYNGAVMHSSELVGTGIAQYIADHAQECDDCLFSLVVVNDLENDDLIGWAIAYREITK